MELSGKKVTVIGLGKSGIAAVEFLAERGVHVSATDLQTAEQLGKPVLDLMNRDVDLHLGNHPEHLFEDMDFIVLSPGVPKSIPPIQKAMQRGIPVIAEVELASWFLKDTLIAVTGSNGKSTTTALTAHLLRTAGLQAEACGNIGTPLIEMVDSTNPERILVVELSSFQLETIDTFAPHAATVLNVTPDHMDRYQNFEAYKQAKYRVFENQTGKDFAVINADERHGREIAERVPSGVVYFGIKAGGDRHVCLRDGIIYWHDGRDEAPLLTAAELSLPGPHNLSNSMASAALALLMGAPRGGVAEGLRSFQPLEHRLEPVGEHIGVTFINDSKATNVESAAVALESFDSPLLVIMGGRDKDSDFTVLNPLLRKQARSVLLIGEAAGKIDAALDKDIRRCNCASLEEAVEKAFSEAERGDVVLLAPGCASFDMFDNFEHRGREFKRIVRRLQDADS
jgi:UDP-N-acetylmuramoylalanine--D-glutamate ligase